MEPQLKPRPEVPVPSFSIEDILGDGDNDDQGDQGDRKPESIEPADDIVFTPSPPEQQVQSALGLQAVTA